MAHATITDVESLRAAVRQGASLDYLLFWGHEPQPGDSVGKECLSQWWPCSLVVDGASYTSAEHYMMAEKARLFGDEEIRAKIVSASGPAQAKRLGRKVRGFEEAKWKAARFEVVVRGNVAKFSQNPALAAFLRATADKVLVEASPVDAIWGIGLAANNPDARNPETWRGLNLLGFALMRARDALRAV